MYKFWIPLVAVMSFNVSASNTTPSVDPFQSDVVVDSIVLFDHDSSVVSYTDKHRINHEFTDAPDTVIFEIGGYTSEVGSTSYNDHLSLHRATAVHKALGKPKAELVANGEMGAPVRMSKADARVDRKVTIHAAWKDYKPTFGYATILVPGPLFHLQGIEPGLGGSAILSLGAAHIGL